MKTVEWKRVDEQIVYKRLMDERERTLETIDIGAVTISLVMDKEIEDQSHQ